MDEGMRIVSSILVFFAFVWGSSWLIGDVSPEMRPYIIGSGLLAAAGVFMGDSIGGFFEGKAKEYEEEAKSAKEEYKAAVNNFNRELTQLQESGRVSSEEAKLLRKQFKVPESP